MCTSVRVLVCAIALCAGCSDPAPPIANAQYSVAGTAASCGPEQRLGKSGTTDGLTTSHGARFNVRAPGNYDAARAHPLLVVYAPAGFSAARTERHAMLTTEATEQGFIVAFADHRPLALKSFDLLAEVPDAVARQWCIDNTRIYFAGHSDGGTTSAAITFLNKSSLAPAGILISGAGIRDQDLAQYPCPAPVNVTVMHSRDDELFPLPRYGSGAALWWARCNGCDLSAARLDKASGCKRFPRCSKGVMTLYCEMTGTHRHWPADGASILRLLQGHELPDGKN